MSSGLGPLTAPFDFLVCHFSVTAKCDPSPPHLSLTRKVNVCFKSFENSVTLNGDGNFFLGLHPKIQNPLLQSLDFEPCRVHTLHEEFPDSNGVRLLWQSNTNQRTPLTLTKRKLLWVRACFVRCIWHGKSFKDIFNNQNLRKVRRESTVTERDLCVCPCMTTKKRAFFVVAPPYYDYLWRG